MPARKGVKSLEESTLRCIGNIFKSTCKKLAFATESEPSHHKDLENEFSAESNTIEFYVSEQRAAIKQIQQWFFEDTAHYFHSHIAKEILIAISDLHKQTLKEHQKITDQADLNFNPRIPSEELRRRRQLLRWKKEQWQTDFVKVLCHPAIKEIDISREALGQRSNLHWAVVGKLCSNLVHIQNLERLNLGRWSCKRFGLLSEHNQNEGWQLKFLPRLRQLCVSDVSERFFQNVGLHCQNLIKLQVYSSEITDQVTSWVAKCQKLEYVELIKNTDVTPIGFAQLLRANVDLKSLGQCDCFAQVLSLLYDKHSMYRRSVTNIPEHLNLEEIDTIEKLAAHQLRQLVRFCPNLKRLRFKYLPAIEFTGTLMRRQHPNSDSVGMATDENSDGQDSSNKSDDFDFNPDEDDEEMHLAHLCSLERLEHLSINVADFYGHLLFRLLEVRGDQLFHLELRNVDELNLNAILLIGSRCSQLKYLGLHSCHFQLQPDDSNTIDDLCRVKHEASKNLQTGNSSSNLQTKRTRYTSTSLMEDSMDHFKYLESLSIYLNSPTHIPMVQYILCHATHLEKLSLNQFFTDFDESFVTQTLFQWNPMLHLKEFEIPNASQLSIMAVNVVIQNCPMLQRLRWISRWRRVDEEQVKTIKKEIKARNFDLIIDEDDLFEAGEDL